MRDEVDRFGAGSGQIWLELDEVRPISAAFRTDSADFEATPAEFGRSLPNFAFVDRI